MQVGWIMSTRTYLRIDMHTTRVECAKPVILALKRMQILPTVDRCTQHRNDHRRTCKTSMGHFADLAIV